MRKLIIYGWLIFGILFFANTEVFAQSDIKIGGGLIFGTGATGIDQIDNDLGIKVDGIYTINEEFRAGVDFGFYFPHEEGDFTLTIWELNFNGNYMFHSEDELDLYGLAGINITGISFDQPSQNVGGIQFGGSSSDSEVGLNIGGGLEYGLDFADLFTELKYVLSDADQLVIGAGLRFPI